MFAKSRTAYLIGLKYKYIRMPDYSAHRDVTNEHCNVYKHVLTPSLFCLIPSLKSKHAFLSKISTNYFHFIYHTQSTNVPTSCMWEWVPHTNFLARQEGMKEDAPFCFLMAVMWPWGGGARLLYSAGRSPSQALGPRGDGAPPREVDQELSWTLAAKERGGEGLGSVDCFYLGLEKDTKAWVKAPAVLESL